MTGPAIAVACVLLAVGTLLFIFSIAADASDAAPHRGQLDALLDRRDAIYDNLRDLRFEHRAGKFSAADYEQMKRALETEAAQVLASMDQLTGGAPTPATRQAMTPRSKSEA